MKNLSQINPDCSGLYASLHAPIQTKLLLAAIELKIFDKLTKPTSADTVAQAISSHPGNTAIFLNALVSIDLLDKKKGLYRNNPVARNFLESNSPTYLGDFLTGASQMMLDGLDNLSDLVRNGGPVQPSDLTDAGAEELWARFAVPMANYARSGSAQQVAKIISALPEFSSFRKMLDLGGGPGIHGIAIVTAHPDMKGIIFDRPAMVKTAEDFISEYQLEERMDAIGGDYILDSIGEEYDLIWASATLNFCRDDLGKVIEKIYSALNPGGVFACLQDGLTEEGTQPTEMVLSELSWSLSSAGMHAFTQGEIADIMLDTGFKSVHSRTINTTDGPMVLDIGRKSK